MKRQNQQNPPSSKKQRVDSLGNDIRRFAVKSGTSTTIIAKLPSINACKAFEEAIKTAIKNLDGKLLVEMTCFK